MSPFKKPDQPRNSWELFKWIWFEYRLLEKYGKTVTKTETFILVLMNYFLYVVPLALLLYIIGIIIVIGIDLPTWMPTQYTKQFMRWWEPNYSFIEKFKLFFCLDYLESMKPLPFLYLNLISESLIWILFFSMFGLGNLALGLMLNSILSLMFSLMFGLVGGMAFDFIAVVLCLVLGLIGGLKPNSIKGFTLGLLVFVIFILVLNIYNFINITITLNLLFIIFFCYVGYFRLPFYFFYFIKSLFVYKLKNNVYFQDDNINLPIWNLTDKLTQQAYQDPETAQQFINFLFEYRPLQTVLAVDISHAATAGIWNSQLLNADKLNSNSIAIIQKTSGDLIPSDKWLRTLTGLKDQLIHAQNQHNIHQSQQGYQEFLNQLTEFRNLTLREPNKWHRYYLTTIDNWITATQAKLSDTTLQAETQESQAKNVYLAGDPLNPQDHSDIFMQRTDLQQELTNRVLTAREMPLFLLLGQRRIGKTSLLNFLPKLFDGSRFKTIYIDCQDPNIGDALEWMLFIRNKINATLELPIENWQPPEKWLKAWLEFVSFLEKVSQIEQRKIILAIDEYDYFHDHCLQEDFKQAERLLGAMRHFSQHQNQVIFLFTGAYSFAELENPNWIKYFPHSVPIKLDYLSKANTIRLITEPVPLEYPPELTEEMYELTQGHPALTQLLCQNLVNLANIQGKKQITANDLHQAITKMLEEGIGVIDNFWGEFCQTPECKQTVAQILHGQPITNRASLNRLAQHGYIIQVNEKWQMRVPLFAQGLERLYEV
ncbi:hypothetical protein QUF74_09700 [Candidatus Halobeggiatoa sp. HSG11]|nr:hypothetical protein [Candidatus Halobeggiatoa sp. HSG11]